jgi:hypothetical protein
LRRKSGAANSLAALAASLRMLSSRAAGGVHSGFLNSPPNVCGALTHARRRARRHRRDVSSRRVAMRQARADTRFVNPEAVFFVLL